MLTSVFPQRTEANLTLYLICFHIGYHCLLFPFDFFRHVLRSASFPTAPRFTAETDAKMAKTLHINVS